MLGKLKEMVTGGSKLIPCRSYLGCYLDKVCNRYADAYKELKSESNEVDALDVLSKLVMSEILPGDIEPAAARAYLSILIDNEHLPPTRQLNEAELTTLRELLLGYFSNSDAVNDKGSQVLALIDKKFTSGEFSQARILLQIFDTSEETKLNNERNLYYEEMILRLDMNIPKPKSIPATIALNAAKPDAPDEAVIKAFTALQKECGANYFLYTTDPDEQKRWANALSDIPQPVKDYLFDYIPVMQWRLPGTLNESIESQIGRHMTFEMLRRHVQIKLRMCYFLLLASGNTGYEWFIFAFTKWSKDHFDVDVRDVFPMLHRCGVVDSLCLQEVLDIVIDRFYGPAMNRIVITPENISNAYRTVLNNLFGGDSPSSCAGDFSLGDFLLDVLMPIEYKDPSFAFRLYAMM